MTGYTIHYGCSLPHIQLQVLENCSNHVVRVIHEHGSMRLKELVAKFKPLMGNEKGDMAQFMAIVKNVSVLVIIVIIGSERV